jgi:hypothetical protein
MEWIASFAVLFGLGALAVVLSQMQNRLQRNERKLNALLRHFNIDTTSGLPLSDRVKEIASDPSRKIQAIKVYREETGAGLAEAKEAVEAFIAGQ